MKDLRNYLDDHGFLIQRDNNRFNAIDSNFLNSNILYMKKYLGDENWINGTSLLTASDLFHIMYQKDKKIIRYYKNFDNPEITNPKESTRYTNPNHVSRDNSMGYLIHASSIGFKKFCKNFAWDTIKRYSFFQNTHTVRGIKKVFPDLCGPSQWTILFRTFLNKPLMYLFYPLILLLDLFYLISYTFHVIQSRFDPTHTSTVLHMLSGVLFCRETVQTPFSYLAEKIFLNYRKQVPGFEHKEPIVSAIKFYSRQSYDPPLQDVVVRVLRKLRG